MTTFKRDYDFNDNYMEIVSSNIKKYRKYIYNRIFNCILLFLIPTIIFLLFNLLIANNNISNVGELRNCWDIVE